MRIKKGFVLRNVCGENVVMGEGLDAIDFGRLLCLNETAVRLFELATAMGDFTVEALAGEMVKEYDVEIDVARADAQEVVDRWIEMGVAE